MTKAELVETVCRHKEYLEDLKAKLKTDEDLIKRMRYGYLKELQHLREQLISKDSKGKRFEYIEVHYFEACELLSEEMCFVLNTKLERMKEMYEEWLVRMKIANNQLMRQIALFEKLGEDGNIGIRF
mmetsp:Transcript_21094/g.20258  ORF Transcript_21094/g.20258 Transcript_21094/m.20258 type:complete len:127 (+) Transcript_21094:137-517(+)